MKGSIPEAVHKAALIRQLARNAAAEHGRARVDVQIDADGVVFFRGDRSACQRAFLQVAAHLDDVRSDCDLADALGRGIHFVLGPPAELDAARGLVDLEPRFVDRATYLGTRVPKLTPPPRLRRRTRGATR